MYQTPQESVAKRPGAKGPISFGLEISVLTSLWDSPQMENAPTSALPWLLVEQGSLMRLSLPSAFYTRTT